jgi:hypothetical protein
MRQKEAHLGRRCWGLELSMYNGGKELPKRKEWGSEGRCLPGQGSREGRGVQCTSCGNDRGPIHLILCSLMRSGWNGRCHSRGMQSMYLRPGVGCAVPVLCERHPH